ncbi:sulfite exporter TauE/SafE family protein [Nocardioides panacis]|uniref:Probable membrane transporter protein n=1 Tax=Nocardioides panacis TaxID=2849501 RepID=A0A975SX34_9ACTN|nr:sulfite exporter TauE/SafE family protein [Nocardioides panacis]QWZ07540.1 sulfite exporter TauE/SafE family protein [Nocardioides panacis]
MDLPFVLAVLAAGFGAGFVLTAVGAGSLVSFPILVGAGLSPLVANVCNNVGLVPGGLTGAFGFRRELAGHRALVLRVATTSAVGALLGAVLLLALPPGAFSQVVPWLVLGSATLVGLGPFIASAVRRRAVRLGVEVADDRVVMGPRLTGLSALIGVYGGYFGAAQGVLLVAVLALGLDVPLSAVNGLKNVAVAAANVAATLVFVFFAPLDWPVVGLIAIGSVVGGWLGAHLGRRLPPTVFRVLVVVFGWAVGLKLLLS